MKLSHPRTCAAPVSIILAELQTRPLCQHWNQHFAECDLKFFWNLKRHGRTNTNKALRSWRQNSWPVTEKLQDCSVLLTDTFNHCPRSTPLRLCSWARQLLGAGSAIYKKKKSCICEISINVNNAQHLQVKWLSLTLDAHEVLLFISNSE